MWQTEGPTRVLALMWAWTCNARAARGRPVCSFGDSEGDGDGVRRRQGSLENSEDLAEKCSFHFKKNGKKLEGFQLGRYGI